MISVCVWGLRSSWNPLRPFATNMQAFKHVSCRESRFYIRFYSDNNSSNNSFNKLNAHTKGCSLKQTKHIKSFSFQDFNYEIRVHCKVSSFSYFIKYLFMRDFQCCLVNYALYYLETFLSFGSSLKSCPSVFVLKKQYTLYKFAESVMPLKGF